ncbi:uncharacterized protein BJ171DRAFT_148338 [Polychytrium aggregatum]|uniref:uncharacterized protein n=1 Tax=Polychytrium aggregatum TaxID=110093 RepID=UPI0022FEF9B1|nr:uncharacterized protein BJ171DRAFT_148338 [Polychytrium aggregatum]KAI9203245.1 hypothetical protein BJ171DRAFT_148338 [Polychytrium aggregatum]
MSLLPPALDPANVRWLLHYGRRSILPRCVNSSNAQALVFPESLGDVLYASDRCMPRAWIDNRTATSYAYLSVVPDSHSIFLSDCGSDSSCRTDCSVAAQFSTLNSDPCTASFFTGAYSNKSYLSTDLWDSGFKTPYFSYIARSFGDSTCTNLSVVVRDPIYQNCTKMPDGSYTVDSNLGSPNMVVWPHGVDANCTAGGNGVEGFTLNNKCVPNQGLAGEFDLGPLLSVPNLSLSAQIPFNVSNPSNGNSQNSQFKPSALLWLIAAPVLIAAVVYLRFKTSRRPPILPASIRQAARSTSTLPRYSPNPAIPSDSSIELNSVSHVNPESSEIFPPSYQQTIQGTPVLPRVVSESQQPGVMFPTPSVSRPSSGVLYAENGSASPNSPTQSPERRQSVNPMLRPARRL